MSRAVLALDRVVALVVGVLMLLVGLALIAWWRGSLGLTGRLDTSAAVAQTSKPWWPWAVGAAGVVLLVLGLRWLLAHLPRRGVSSLRLPGSGQGGRLTAAVAPIGEAAAQELQRATGVRSARATVIRERGEVVAHVRGTIEPHADLAFLAARADALATDLRTVLGREDLRCRVDLRVAGSKRSTPRVR